MSDRNQSRARRAKSWRALAAVAAMTAPLAAAGCSHHAGPAAASPAATTAPASAGSSDADSVVAMLLQEGITQAEQKKWADATTTFNDVLDLSPRNVYALYNLGLIQQSAGNVAGADNYYNQAIAVDASYTPALYNLAITLENTNSAKALSLYQKIVAINPQASTAYLRMAFVYAQRGETQDAKVAQAKAAAIDPSLGKVALPAKK